MQGQYGSIKGRVYVEKVIVCLPVDNMNALIAAVFAVVLAVANAGIIGLHGGLVGSGIEGQYVPSGLEHLYDDGSYRGEHHLAGHGVLGLGLGLAAPGVILGGHGSGLEGQYIPSGNELLHDDGSYRLEHHLAGAHGLLIH